ncbi:heparinase II/III family protein [Alkalicoccus halolimnae]|uniref:Heparinase II/III family protein n=1 Tax=Alkalicoccus halolimnae TaxID=1667239 RepID=A0A5C7FNT9_9BACI|nr:heparinase II/III family protein [Alkalicoccus halolimnae]TXF87006.1 hypothetical protein FTX54_03515 [Alkalicoccus halolimnae]
MASRIKLYINTIKYLKPSQILYRIKNKVHRELYKKDLFKIKVPDKVPVNENHNYLLRELEFNEEYLAKFNPEEILENNFEFISISHEVDLSTAWNDPKLQHLWRYNLHYFEYLYPLAQRHIEEYDNDMYYQKCRYFIDNWINHNPVAYGDGWHSYTISLRLTNWIAVYEIFKNEMKKDPDFHNKFIDSLYKQYQYLQSILEKDVLGNHYFENIKALLIASIFFEDSKVREKFKKELLKQLKEQILEDGMHFELSPMYHKIILEDLIKITYWLKEDSIYEQLRPTIKKMIDVTFSLEDGFGKTPAFNDSTDGISKDYKSLLAVSEKNFSLTPEKKYKLETSGFYITENGDNKRIFDTGDVSPTYLPAHAHCDALSFELSVKSLPMIVNSGTYRYENGKWRDYFRSTKAHNTVTVDNQEQSQFWGSFRVAKRIKKLKRNIFNYNGIQYEAGQYVSYQGVKHKRFIGNIDEHTFIVLDEIKAKTKADINSFIHFIPEVNFEINNSTMKVTSEDQLVYLTGINTNKVEVNLGWYSKQFNVKEENKHIRLTKSKNKNLFGYLIEVDSNRHEIIPIKNGLKVINKDKEYTINYKKLGVML